MAQDDFASYGERLFRLFVQTVREYAIFAMDPQGRIVHWNDGAAYMTGYSEQEVLGRPLHEIFTPEDVAAGAPDQELATAAHVGRAADERWHQRKDGSRFWALGMVLPLHDESGQLVGFGKILCDRTDLKELQETLGRHAEALRVADEHKNRFLATLAHELRNPQSALMSSAALLLRQSRSDPELHRLAQVVDRQVRHSARLVHDLDDIAHISRGKLQLDRQTLDLRQVASLAAESVAALMKERGHDFKYDVSALPVWVSADRARMQQIIANLLANAARYTPEGGRIGMTLSMEDSDAVLRVYDTGVGIRPEQLGQIFELFSQAHTELAESRAGLGIGLALARDLVTAHGGSIQARSEGVGKGSEFIVRLPTAAAEAGRSADPLSTSAR